MPELPEVETTRRALLPHAVGQTIARVTVRTPKLRQPIPPALPACLEGCILQDIRRRAKYLLFQFEHGTLILHLGMSGSLRIVPAFEPPQPHDHLDLELADGHTLRLRDPRRFGIALWHQGAFQPEQHPLFAHLGPEPLDDTLTPQWLHRRAQNRRPPIKTFIMDQRHLVGVGNIYASESLYRARIHPDTPAARLSLTRWARLLAAIRQTLQDALAAGGSTLRDFVSGESHPGYFQQSYNVYGRTGQPCHHCGTPIRQTTHANRSTWYCPRCQR